MANKIRIKRLPIVAAPVAALAAVVLFYPPFHRARAHSGPRQAAPESAYGRSEHTYGVPKVWLRDRRDRPVALRDLLAGDRPIVLQFIFTSCETVCPMLTAMTAQAQSTLRGIDGDTRIVSISIDPDYDTPARMARYADQFGARGDWRFLTGSRGDIRRVLAAFDAVYPGANKTNHRPYTYLRAAGSPTWVRLDGLFRADLLAGQYRLVVQ